ncbi:hypothetical protein RUND412_010122 [Rhizina undulata]
METVTSTFKDAFNIATPLQRLALDEQAVSKRKLQISAHFGSIWIRPVGFQKTLQGELDEIAEGGFRGSAGPYCGPYPRQHHQSLASTDLDADIPEAAHLDEDEEELEAEDEEGFEGEEDGSEGEDNEEEDDEEEEVEQEEDDKEEDDEAEKV